MTTSIPSCRISGRSPSGTDSKRVTNNTPFFTLTYLKPLAAGGLIEMTNPESPNSPQQSYRLTSKGYAAVA